MKKQKIKLFQTRDFAQNLQLSIAFIKQNYLSISKGLCYLIPLFLVVAFLQPDSAAFQTNIYNESNPFAIYRQIYTLPVILGNVLSLLGFTFVMVYVASYMAIYSESKNGEVNQPEVWSRSLRAIVPVFFGQILYSVIMTFGLILCIIPGIIFAVFFMFYGYVYIVEDYSLIESFKKSWQLVKNNWWVTFGYSVVVGVSMTIVGGILFIPSCLVSLGAALKIDIFSSGAYQYIANTISNVGMMFICPVVYIAFGIMYFNLRNRIENIDIYDDINAIGNGNPHNNN